MPVHTLYQTTLRLLSLESEFDHLSDQWERLEMGDPNQIEVEKQLNHLDEAITLQEEQLAQFLIAALYEEQELLIDETYRLCLAHSSALAQRFRQTLDMCCEITAQGLRLILLPILIDCPESTFHEAPQLNAPFLLNDLCQLFDMPEFSYLSRYRECFFYPQLLAPHQLQISYSSRTQLGTALCAYLDGSDSTDPLLLLPPALPSPPSEGGKTTLRFLIGLGSTNEEYAVPTDLEQSPIMRASLENFSLQELSGQALLQVSALRTLHTQHSSELGAESAPAQSSSAALLAAQTDVILLNDLMHDVQSVPAFVIDAFPAFVGSEFSELNETYIPLPDLIELFDERLEWLREPFSEGTLHEIDKAQWLLAYERVHDIFQRLLRLDEAQAALDALLPARSFEPTSTQIDALRAFTEVQAIYVARQTAILQQLFSPGLTIEVLDHDHYAQALDDGLTRLKR